MWIIALVFFVIISCNIYAMIFKFVQWFFIVKLHSKLQKNISSNIIIIAHHNLSMYKKFDNPQQGDLNLGLSSFNDLEEIFLFHFYFILDFD